MPHKIQLLEKIKHRATSALASGHLHKIDTEHEIIKENNIPFIVRFSHNNERKKQAKESREKTNKEFNPFLPYEKEMYVCDLSESHICLLNKFNVVDNHSLIVTKAYEPQSALLTTADFTAAAIALEEIDGLIFYNGGQTAGASQHHKHLQLIPKDFVPESTQLPIESALRIKELEDNKIQYCKTPYPHLTIRLRSIQNTDSLTRGEYFHHQYHQLCSQLKIADSDNITALTPYNLLMTRDWIIIVLRNAESFKGISLNSLAFAGSFFVKNNDQLQALKEHGLLNALNNVCIKLDS